MFFLSKHPLRACVRVVTLSVAMISVDRANELSEKQLDRGRAQLDLLCDCVGACMRIFCIPACRFATQEFRIPLLHCALEGTISLQLLAIILRHETEALT